MSRSLEERVQEGDGEGIVTEEAEDRGAIGGCAGGRESGGCGRLEEVRGGSGGEDSSDEMSS